MNIMKQNCLRSSNKLMCLDVGCLLSYSFSSLNMSVVLSKIWFPDYTENIDV